jgi:polar amino acid transport system substrate-binding protein
MSIRTLRRVAWPAVLSATVLGLAACGDSGDSDSGSSGTSSSGGTSTTATRSADVAAQVPAAIKSKGTLTVAADATYAPNEFIASDGKTVQGTDADLAKAIGAVMGLKTTVRNQTFDSIIPGLEGHKYDMGMSSFTDTKEREQTVDFVTYFSAGTSFFVKADGGPDIQTLDDLCGKKVALQKGTTQADDAAAQSKKCTADGKSKVTVLVLPDQPAANLALSSGRAEVSMADSPVAAYQVKQSQDQFKLSGEPYGTAPYGIAIPKDTDLENAVLAAVKQLIDDGTYLAILKKWGVQDGAIADPTINGATS